MFCTYTQQFKLKSIQIVPIEKVGHCMPMSNTAFTSELKRFHCNIVEGFDCRFYKPVALCLFLKPARGILYDPTFKYDYEMCNAHCATKWCFREMECILYVLRSRLDVGSPGLLGGPTWAPLAVSHNTHPHKSLWATAESKLYFGSMFCLVCFGSNDCAAMKSYMIHIWRLIKVAKTTSYNYLITHPHKSLWASAESKTCNV